MKEKYIYKVTNNINGKIYIGQTNNIKRRMQEHKHDKRAGHLLHNAIVKYGFENFSIDVLYYGEHYNQKEKEFIKQYDSQNPTKGYNLVAGGEDSSGESNPMAILTKELANMIKDEILSSSNSFKDIAIKFNIPVYFVNHINYGESFADSKLSYPLRKSKRIPKTKLINIIADLKNSLIEIDEISKKYNVPKYTILNINKGLNYKQENQKYPIRELGLTQNIRNEIIRMLKETELSGKQIALIHNVSIGIVYRINNGSTWHDNNIKYPIRQLKSVVVRNEHN